MWLDAHADFNTPDIDAPGFLDGHGLAMAVGRCWQTFPSIAPADSYAVPGGLLAEDVQQLLRQTADRLPIVSATLASYDPDFDSAGQMRDTALDLLELLADLGTPTDA